MIRNCDNLSHKHSIDWSFLQDLKMKKYNNEEQRNASSEKGLLRIMIFATILGFAVLGVAVVSLQGFINSGHFEPGVKEGVAGIIGALIGWFIWKVPSWIASRSIDKQ